MASPRLLIADPQLIKHVLLKDFQYFSDRGVYHNEKANPLSGHMFAVEAAKWKNLRVKLSPTFTSGKMKMMFQTLVDCSDPMVELVTRHINNELPIDIKEVLGCFTTDVIGSCAFGLECKSFQKEDAEFRKQGKRLFTPTLKQLVKNTVAFSSPELARKMNLSIMEKDHINFFMKVVKDNIDFREKNNFIRNDFFQLLIDIKKESETNNGKPFTVEEFAAQVFCFSLRVLKHLQPLRHSHCLNYRDI